MAPTTATTMLLSRQLARTATGAHGVRRIPQGAYCSVLQHRGYATPSGPPPPGFRLKPPVEWDQEKEGTFDRVGKYFLLTEMARGMYVLLEQFFRPP